jgi:hypothetical protein
VLIKNDLDQKEVFYQKRLTLIGKILTDLTEGIFDYIESLKASKIKLFNILEKTKPGAEEEQKKFIDILASIERQISLLDQKWGHLYRFEQRLNKPVDHFDPEEVIKESVLFSTRLARKCNVSLSVKVDRKLPNLYFNSVYFHFLISILIHNMIKRMGADSKVIVSARPNNNGLWIEIKGENTSEAGISPHRDIFDESWPITQQLVDNLEGHLQPEITEGAVKRMELYFPIKK